MNMKFICVIGYMPKIQNLYEKKNTNPFLQYSWSAKINTIVGIHEEKIFPNGQSVKELLTL